MKILSWNKKLEILAGRRAYEIAISSNRSSLINNFTYQWEDASYFQSEKVISESYEATPNFKEILDLWYEEHHQREINRKKNFLCLINSDSDNFGCGKFYN
jgi:hypothetical protein